MENAEKKKYLDGKIGLRDILQAFANLAIIYIAYKLWAISTAIEMAKEIIK